MCSYLYLLLFKNFCICIDLIKTAFSIFKANVGSVIEQLDTLLELKCKFESDIQEYGRNSTQVLEKAIIGKILFILICWSCSSMICLIHLSNKYVT